MKFVLFCIVLFGVGCQASNDYWHGHVDGYHSYHGLKKHHENNHDHDHIEEPCLHHDLNCIRNFFAHKSGCYPVYGPAPEPYFFKKISMDIPHSHITATMYEVQLKGLNSGKIVKFFINKKTDTLVLEVEFGSLFVYTPKSVIEYYRKGKEPIIGSDSSMIEFKHLSLTLTIQHLHDTHLAKRHVYAYLSDPHPPLKVGHKLHEIEELGEEHKQWMDDLSLTVKEAMIAQAPSYFNAFFSTKICNYIH